MRALLATWRELAVDYDTLPKLLYVFGHKTEYTSIVVTSDKLLSELMIA